MNPAILGGVVVTLLASMRDDQQSRPSLSPATIVAMMIWMILGPALPIELALLLEALGRGAWLDAMVALTFTIATIVVLFPWPITRAVLIPTGRVKLAWALTRLSFWVWRRDVRGGAVIAASWAAIRRAQTTAEAGDHGPVLDPERLAWIERRRDALPVGSPRWRLGGAGIVASGLLAEAVRDRAGARRLLGSALELSPPTRPTQAVALASEWLCAEAIDRGAWREVESLARTAPVLTRRLRWWAAVAGRLTGVTPPASDSKLRWLWSCAPNRVDQLGLLRRALASSTIAPPRAARSRSNSSEVSDPAEDRESPGDPLLVALTLHGAVLQREPSELGPDDLTHVARAWDRALADPSLDRRLLARAVALGTQGQDQGSAQLAALVREDLLALIRAAGLALGAMSETSELLDGAARQLQAELLDELETSAGALHGRVRARRELPAIDEWQSFLALREQYVAAVALGGLELRRLAFAEVHAPACGLAVWLWNDRSERALGNAIFQWLLAEAIVVDDAEAVRLQERNVDCGV